MHLKYSKGIRSFQVRVPIPTTLLIPHFSSRRREMMATPIKGQFGYEGVRVSTLLAETRKGPVQIIVRGSSICAQEVTPNFNDTYYLAMPRTSTFFVTLILGLERTSFIIKILSVFQFSARYNVGTSTILSAE